MNAGSGPDLQQAANRPGSDPFGSSSRPAGRFRLVAIAVAVSLVLTLAAQGRAQSVWQVIAQFIGLRGKPEPASANVLSEHEIVELDNMTPQAQAGLLLERSINHVRGATTRLRSA